MTQNSNPTVRRDLPSVGVGYALALGATALAGLLRWLLPDVLSPAPYLGFYPAVVVAAALGGVGPGLVATFASLFLVDFVFGRFDVYDHAAMMRQSVWVIANVGVSILAGRLSMARALAEQETAKARAAEHALRQQVELIDSVRAEIIAREMQRVVRERAEAHVPPVQSPASWLRRVPNMAGTAVAGVGLLVLLGWLFGLETLKGVLPGMATMKANTAVCFLFAGLALAWREPRALRIALSALVFTVAGLTLTEYVLGTNLGLDQLLFRDTAGPHTVYPGRMVEATALAFMLGSGSLALLGAQRQVLCRVQQTLAVGVGLIGLVAVLGYLYNVEQLYRFSSHSSMALHTGVSFGLLAIGLLLGGHQGLATILMGHDPGAQLARRLLPAALLVPVFIGLLCQEGLQHGFYSSGMDTAIFALTALLSLLALVLWAARALNRADETRRATESQLRNQAELIDQAEEALVIRELGGSIRSWNRGAEALYGWPATDAVGQRSHVLLHTAGAVPEQVDTQLERTGHWEGELVHTTRDGRHVIVESSQTAVRATDGRLLVLKSDRDITQRKAAEQALRESEAKLALALRSAGMGVWRLDLMQKSRQFDDQVCRCLGIEPTRFVGTAEEFYAAVHPEDRPALQHALARTIETGAPYEIEYRAVWPDRTIHYITARGQLARDSAAQPLRIDGLVWDVTERKQAEEVIRTSLREKEVLLREIHHRVKNNLQVISSLMDLQADTLRDSASMGVFAEMRDRVRSMALVHEKLYQSESLASVEFAEYASSLLENLWRAHAHFVDTIRLKLDLNPVSLSVVAAVPCGLLLNELVINALKHAFRGRAGGEIAVALATSNGNVLLSVSDDGVGLPTGLDWRRSRSLGLKLVQLLTDQLDGTLEVKTGPGTKFLITFAQLQPE